MLYLLANLAYLLTLPLTAIQNAPADRVATAMMDAIAPGFGGIVDGDCNYGFDVWMR